MLAALLALLASGVAQAGIRIEGGGGSQTYDQGPPQVWTVLVEPTLGVDGSGPDFFGTARYTPRLFVGNTVAGGSNSLLHTGQVVGGWRPSKTSSVRLSEIFAWGTTTFSPLVAGTAIDPRLASISKVGYAASTTVAQFEGTFSRQVGWSARAGYQITGGISEVDRLLVPRQGGPLAEGGIHYAFDRLDLLTFSATYTRPSFANQQDVSLGTASVALRRQVDVNTVADVRLGAAVGNAGDARGGVARPDAAASLFHGFRLHGARVTATGRLSLTSVIDPLQASIDYRADGWLGLVYGVRNLQFSVNGGAGRIVAGAGNGEAVYYANVELLWNATREIALITGSRMSRLEGAQQVAQPRLQVAGYVAASAQVRSPL